MSQIKSYTTNFSMKIPEFNIATWHDAMEYNFTLIDALLGNFFEINNFKGPWLIVTGYQTNDIVYINNEDDQYVGKIFKVLQDHVSGNTKFETFYTEHPEYYEEYADMNGVVNYFNMTKDYAIKMDGKVIENGTPIDYSAKYYANEAKDYATLASEHESNAFSYKTDAENAKNSAEGYATAAQGYMNNAEQYKDDALSYMNSAGDAATLATQAKTDAQSAANSASSSQTGAETAELNAQGYANSAASSANAASNSASDALGYKNDAQSYANSAASYDSIYQQYLEDTQEASTDAQTAASGAQTAKDNAVTWAQGTDEEVTVLGGEHSAKGWAGVIKTILANIVCNTTTIDPGDPAEVTSTGDEDEIILNFFIPQGLKGDQGDQGVPGQDGADGQDGFSPSASVTQSGNVTTISITDKDGTTTESIDLSYFIPYTGAISAVDLNNKNLKNVSNLAVGTSTIDNNEKILSIGQNRIVTNNNNGLFISSTTSQTRKGMYGVPMALEIQFNSNNQAYSYPLGFHDMNSNNNGGQFLFTSFSSNIGAATAGDVMVENDKGGLIFNTGNSKSGSKMRFVVGNWQATPQLTLTANSVGVKTTNPNSSYALDVNGTLNATDILINGQPIQVETDANVQYTSGGGGTEYVDLSSLYIDSQGASYGFYYDSMSSTIKNSNQQVDNSYSYAFIELYLENDGDVTISFSQDSEQNYDFGEISELDQYLAQDNQQDSDYVAWSGQEYSSISDSITFSNVTAGYHFFTIKYIKDSSSESGTDTFEITSIEVGGSSGGSLIDTNTQEEIPLSQINDMPQAFQAIREEIPDTSNFVTIDTKQMMTAPKAITGTDTPWGSDQVQKNLFMAVSNSNTTAVVEWIGRSMFGANNLTFLMGTINNMAALGAHSWTSAKQGTGAAWADMYFNPDGDKAIKIGGSPMVGRPSIMVIQNMGQTTTGTVKINRRALLTQTALYKDVACWDDPVTKFDFTQISGYNSSSNQMLTHDTSGNLKWVNI